MSIESIVIAGAGQAGLQVAVSLRQEGYTGKITMIGDEPGVPYQRPPLSKAYLLGKVTAQALCFRQPEFFVEQNIERVQGVITAIDREHRQVRLADGSAYGYDHLVLALGARNRVPAVPGIELKGVLGIRTLEDADTLSPLMEGAKNAVVIGAGFIGLEFAAVAAARGMQVHVLELGTRPMARAISAEMSAVFDQTHRANGVQIHYGTGIERINGENGKASSVVTTNGHTLPADIVIYGIGVIPNAELAKEAGLTVDNGIAVNEVMLTSDAHISSLGDVASFPCVWVQRNTRLESVQNAVDQAKAIAARLVGKAIPAYDALPWFWTDQGDLKLQIAGMSDGYDQTVVLGSQEAKQLSILCFRQGKLVAVESCNKPIDHMSSRKLIARHTPLTVAEASAPGFDLKAYEAATRPAA